MFLSKFFSNARAKVLCALAGLTLVFGAGAAISAGVSAVNDNEVVETGATAVTENYLRLYATVSWSNLQSVYGRSDGSADFTQMTQSVTAHGNYPGVTTSGDVYVADLALSSAQNWLNFKFYTKEGNTYRETHPDTGGKLWDTTEFGINLDGSYDNNFEPGCAYSITNIAWEDGYTNNEHAWFTFSCTQTGVFVHYDYASGTAAGGTAQHAEQSTSANYTTQAAPSREHYTFSGWTRSDTGETVNSSTNIGKLTSSVTFTANWTPVPQYTVTKKYLVDGAVGSTIGTADSVYSGSTWSAPAQDAKAGYVANGWYKSDKTTAISSPLTITGNTTVYSKYTKQDLYFRVKSNSYAADSSHKLTETVTFGDSYATYSGSLTLAAGDMFKIANSGWNPVYGANNNDRNSKTFCNYLTSPSAVFEAGTDGDTTDNIKAKLAGTYSITMRIYADGSFEITNLTRSPGSLTISYYSVKDGVETKIGSDVTVWSGTTYSADSSRVQADVFGYTSAHWYTAPILSAEYLYVDGSTVSDNLALYQIYTQNEYKMYYFEVYAAYARPNADWASTVYIHVWDANGAKKTWAEDDQLSFFYKDTEDDRCIVLNAYLPVGSILQLHSTKGAQGVGTQTQYIYTSGVNGPDEDKMCYQINTLVNNWEWGGEWVAFEAGFKLKDSGGDTLKSMTKPDTGSNMAYATDVSIVANQEVYVSVALSIAGTATSDVSVYSLGTTYSYATQMAFTIKITANDTYNFYLNEYHQIYITSASEIAKAGTFYLSNSKGWTNVYAYSYISSTGATPLGAWPGKLITTIESTESTKNLNFNSSGNLYKLMVNDLSGTSETKADRVVFNDGSKATEAAATVGTNKTAVITISSVTTAPNYYLDDAQSSAVTLETTVIRNNGLAAKAAFDIEVAIRGATSSSACNISTVSAGTLVEEYDDASKAGVTLHQTASIETWDPATVTLGNLTPASDTDDVSISVIVTKTIRPISQGLDPQSVNAILYKNNSDSPLTTTLWIVLGAGIAGLTAIGAAYFISKKRKRA